MGISPFWTRTKDMGFCVCSARPGKSARPVYSVTCPLESSYTTVMQWSLPQGFERNTTSSPFLHTSDQYANHVTQLGCVCRGPF